MLPKVNRLTKKKDFDAVFKTGQGVKAGFLIAKAIKNTLPANRFGFVVSKKVSAKAVVRNKIKRQLRSAVEQAIKSSVARGAHFDVVIIALPTAATKEFQEIKTAVASLLKKISP